MKTILIIIILLVLVGGGYWLIQTKYPSLLSVQSPTPTLTVTPTSMVYDQSISDGTVTIKFPSDDFGLATTPSQVLVSAYIPPCDQKFNYCIYFKSNQYQGTNFESAGLRIQKRSDLATERLCLNTPPSGYAASVTPSATGSESTYSKSVFTPIGNAAAGHYANGELYRLFIRNSSSCYEFETRVGQSQFANYPAGSIKEFTSADQSALLSYLRVLVNTITLKDGTKIQWP